ncbi:MarR family winged helix-turn-helix transcriptional regulator [uncultured Methanobrevibacter sp.]|uniref:MarR family winged helix-turn-helix transcriptional regulator n=1 Tax=uncultured Methanobrevibacter sp. TaxID=253161 RepID=UPI00260074B9|nr:MarR family winged helix-turn-helix transcriptional regulator [uncultured Methanobrevibacter sp.]
MTLPEQFQKENTENIFIYHYVEEMIANYGRYIKEILDETEITRAEIPFLIRVRFSEKTTQKELVELFKVSEGYTAKLLRKFEDLGYITRHENPDNRRQKIVELTDKGVEKTDELIKIINDWEIKVTSNMTKEEVKLLKSLLFKVVVS